MSAFSPGLRLHDRFTLLARVGAGGMSEVWRATDEVLGRDVAVKALLTPLAADPGLRQTTWREARAAARLTHPNITQVHDYGEVPLPAGGTAGYLVMELVEGQTLADRLAGGPLPWQEAAAVGRQVASALGAAHRLGIVHRDVKPGNVMLTGESVKVLDFGIAAVAGRPDTDPGRLVGTPRYTAPERFDTTAPARPASDIYSLGVLLYEALVGRPPTSSRDWPEAVAAQRADATLALPAVPGVPAELARLCAACLSADPDQRPEAGQVVAVLASLTGAGGGAGAGGGGGGGDAAAAVGAGPGAGAGPEPTVPQKVPPTLVATGPGGSPEVPARRWPGRVPLVALGMVLLLAVLGAVLVAALRGGGQEPAAGADPTAPPSATATPGGATPAAVTPAEIVAALDREIRAGFNDGRMTRDAYDDLRDELGELRDALAEDEPAKREEELAKAVAELRDEVQEQLADGEIDASTAETLIALVDEIPLA